MGSMQFVESPPRPGTSPWPQVYSGGLWEVFAGPWKALKPTFFTRQICFIHKSDLPYLRVRFAWFAGKIDLLRKCFIKEIRLALFTGRFALFASHICLLVNTANLVVNEANVFVKKANPLMKEVI